MRNTREKIFAIKRHQLPFIFFLYQVSSKEKYIASKLIVLGTPTLVVTLCRLPENGRKVLEAIVEKTKERDREERGTGMKK